MQKNKISGFIFIAARFDVFSAGFEVLSSL